MPAREETSSGPERTRNTFAPIYRGTYLSDILSINSQPVHCLCCCVLNRSEACRHRRAVLTGVVRLSRRRAERRRGEKGRRDKEREAGGKKREKKKGREGERHALWRWFRCLSSHEAIHRSGFSPRLINPATRYTPSTPEPGLVLLDFDCAGAEEAAEHGGTLLAI